MQDSSPQPNISGPTTTADSAAEGRLMVDVNNKKRKIIKKKLTQSNG